MQLYLIAYPSIVIAYNEMPIADSSYGTDLRDTTGSIDLINWLNLREHRRVYKVGTGRSSEIELTPVSQIVPWLLAGLREAVMKELTYDLLKIIATVKQAGFRSDELDVIEQSIIYR